MFSDYMCDVTVIVWKKTKQNNITSSHIQYSVRRGKGVQWFYTFFFSVPQSSKNFIRSQHSQSYGVELDVWLFRRLCGPTAKSMAIQSCTVLRIKNPSLLYFMDFKCFSKAISLKCVDKKMPALSAKIRNINSYTYVCIGVHFKL